MSGMRAGSTTWIPGRGDYGTEYASELIEVIESGNCKKGCLRSGSDAEKAEFGPGGNCGILAMVALGDGETPVPELDPTPRYPTCRVREPIPTDFEVATRDMEPLFELGSVQ